MQFWQLLTHGDVQGGDVAGSSVSLKGWVWQPFSLWQLLCQKCFAMQPLYSGENTIFLFHIIFPLRKQTGF